VRGETGSSLIPGTRDSRTGSGRDQKADNYSLKSVFDFSIISREYQSLTDAFPVPRWELMIFIIIDFTARQYQIYEKDRCFHNTISLSVTPSVKSFALVQAAA